MNRRAQGARGEEQAVSYLLAEGYRILERNFTGSAGEVDIIAVRGRTLVFVEVKSWKGFGMSDLEYALSSRKKERIVRTAREFLLRGGFDEERFDIRFDVVFIGRSGEVRHIPAAFDGTEDGTDCSGD
ncbi:YraN family protein [Spirochaeta thermophila]|nr:YraN family protein [Spirochaeta thermophila]